MQITASHPTLDEMVLLVVPEDAHVRLHELTVGMMVSMRLVRYTDVINGWCSVPENHDARIRFITEDMKPTLRRVGLLQGDRPTGARAITMVTS